MPTYLYRREDKSTFEITQKITEPALTNCPTTGQPVTRLISSGAGLVFKGSGFYLTDYVRNGNNEASREKSESSSKGSESSSKGSESSSKGSESSSKGSESSSKGSESSSKSSDSDSSASKSRGSSSSTD